MDAFEKSLTQQEIDAPTYFDWSDETLGRAARWMAEKFKEQSPDGFKGVTVLGACYHLINVCRETNAGELKLTLDNFTYKKQNTGDWEIIIRKKSEEEQDDDNPYLLTGDELERTEADRKKFYPLEPPRGGVVENFAHEQTNELQTEALNKHDVMASLPRCDYRNAGCVNDGEIIDGVWVCNNHKRKYLV